MPEYLQELLDSTALRLSQLSDTPQLDAQVLLAQVAEKPRTWVIANPASSLNSEQSAKLSQLIERLEQGEPLPYVVGHWEFFSLDFDITPHVLIPRPETELLVERAISWLNASPERHWIADIGTGSGCIAVSLATHIPDIRILATDISLPALKVARHNALKFNVTNKIDFMQCDLFPEPIYSLSTDQHFGLVCANLPYIPTEKLNNLPIFGREPTIALDGGADGLDPFRKFFSLIPDWMASGGRILLEVESTRSLAVLSLAYDAFSSAAIHLHQDLSGQDRLLEIQLPGK